MTGPVPVVVSRADPGEAAVLAQVGEVTVAAYAGFTTGPEDPYLEQLADAATRAAQAELWVARDGSSDSAPGRLLGGVLGSVTSCPPGSPWREVAHDDEGEFRMLSVHPAARGRGVGRALVQHVEDRWRSTGARGMAISSLREMQVAHALYASLGYHRAPERDWGPRPGVDLLVFTKELG